MNRKYIYTNKKHSYSGIMASSLGVIDLITIFCCIRATYKAGGVATEKYAATLILALAFSFIGIILGLAGKSESDRFYLFAYLGLILNGIAIIAISAVLYAGAYWI